MVHTYRFLHNPKNKLQERNGYPLANVDELVRIKCLMSGTKTNKTGGM